jgi:hypothetical protein
VKKAIDTDKAARAGQDIDGKNQGGSVGEATGTLTKGEQTSLDKKIEAIRARHKKSLDAQLKALEGTAKASKGAAGAVDSYSFSLDQNTEAGRRNAAAFSGEIDTAQTHAMEAYQAAIDGSKGAEAALKAYRDSLMDWYNGIVEQAGRAGYDIGQVAALLASLNMSPAIILKLVVTVDDAELTAAEKRVAKLKFGKWNDPNADPKKDPKTTTPKPETIAESRRPRWNPATGEYSTYLAAGGEVYGPGGPTSDSVPIWASRGEYVINASQFAANADLVRAINNSTGRVSGGMTIGAVNVTEASPSGVRQNVIDGLAEAAYRGGVVR